MIILTFVAVFLFFLIPLVTVVGFFSLAFWIDPLRYWANPRWYYIQDARNRYRRHQFYFWIPFFACVLSIIGGFSNLILDRVVNGSWLSNPLSWLFVVSGLVLVLPAGFISGWVSHEVEKRFLAATESAHCLKCGYNLRGNPNTKACPECGEVVTKITVD